MKAKTGTCGIVVLLYNSVSKLGKSFDLVLEGLRRSDHDKIHIVFIDNHSSDNTYEYVRSRVDEWHIPTSVIRLDKNYGIAGGYNRGALALRHTDYILFLNDDVILNPDTVKTLVNVLDSESSIGAIAPLIKHPEGNYEIGHLLGLGAYSLPLEDFCNIEDVKATHLLDVDVVPGCALMTRTNLFFKAKMFDEDLFPWGGDDVDYSWRLHLMGLRTVVTLRTQVFHYGSATFKEKSVREYFGIRNSWLVLFKNCTFRILPLAIILKFAETMKILLWHCKKRKVRHLVYSIRGLLDAIKLSPLFIKKRRYVERTTKAKFSTQVDLRILLGR